MEWIKGLFGLSNESELKRLSKIADKVDALEDAYRALTDAELQGKTAQFKERLQKGETLDDLLPEAFAAAREAGDRVTGKRMFRVQIIGGIVLHQGRIAEMKTGEGKTLTAVLPAYLNALTGGGVHIVTVNDYLAKFQGESMGRIFRYLGLSIGLILNNMDNAQRRASYAADVTYGTNNEFGFDYLRDNMVTRKELLVQRELNFAIVDEVDSILIDEARTPLIISGAGDKSTDMYERADRFVSRLRAETDYVFDEKLRTAALTEEGTEKAESYFNVENLADVENAELSHYIQNAIRAHTLMKRDVNYIVKDGEVLIVDEFTGRLMPGRRYSDGLHQAIEAKEHVRVNNENRTLATITFQNYFRMYKKLSGMTGTAKTEEAEFKGIYSLDVVVIPTNKEMIRIDYNDQIYRNEGAKFAAVVREIAELKKTGRPVLVGTVSVEKSELLSRLLTRQGIDHVVLNAKYHEREAEIVAQAGKLGAVTIATNMAGRGTDILLGGNPEFLARQQMRRDGYSDELIEEAQSHGETQDEEILAARAEFARLLKEFSKETDAEHERVVALGGLHIIGTERHEARRIDNQLRGRAGRQGDPGSSRFYVSMEDDLMRLFGGERMSSIVDRLNVPEDMPIEHTLLSRQIEAAQKKVEAQHYDSRRHVLEYDDVMNQQRTIIYGQRRQVLMGENFHSQITAMVEELCRDAVKVYCPEGVDAENWDLAGLNEYLSRFFLEKGALTNFDEKTLLRLTAKDLADRLSAQGREAYEARFKKEAAGREELFYEVERSMLLRVVDQKWMDHIDNMDQLRQGIGLRALGQKDPVQEYKFEGFNMFEEMIRGIREDIVSLMFRVRLERAPVRRESPITQMHTNRGGEEAVRKPVRSAKKVGRNDPCPCGSGKKYKQCCGRNA